MNERIKPIGLDDVRALIVGGDGHCDTYGVAFAMALDAMTAASLDLSVTTDALYSEVVSLEEVQLVLFRVAQQLKNTAKICWRVAGTEGIMFDDARQGTLAAEPEEGEAAE